MRHYTIFMSGKTCIKVKEVQQHCQLILTILSEKSDKAVWEDNYYCLKSLKINHIQESNKWGSSFVWSHPRILLSYIMASFFVFLEIHPSLSACCSFASFNKFSHKHRSVQLETSSRLYLRGCTIELLDRTITLRLLKVWSLQSKQNR